MHRFSSFYCVLCTSTTLLSAPPLPSKTLDTRLRGIPTRQKPRFPDHQPNFTFRGNCHPCAQGICATDGSVRSSVRESVGYNFSRRRRRSDDIPGSTRRGAIGNRFTWAFGRTPKFLIPFSTRLEFFSFYRSAALYIYTRAFFRHLPPRTRFDRHKDARVVLRGHLSKANDTVLPSSVPSSHC